MPESHKAPDRYYNQFDYYRLHYGVPAGRGVRILYDGEHAGTILSAGNHLRVRFDHPIRGKLPTIGNMHPTWRMKYLVGDEQAAHLLGEAKARRRRQEKAAKRFAAQGVYHA